MTGNHRNIWPIAEGSEGICSIPYQHGEESCSQISGRIDGIPNIQSKADANVEYHQSKKKRLYKGWELGIFFIYQSSNAEQEDASAQDLVHGTCQSGLITVAQIFYRFTKEKLIETIAIVAGPVSWVMSFEGYEANISDVP